MDRTTRFLSFLSSWWRSQLKNTHFIFQNHYQDWDAESDPALHGVHVSKAEERRRAATAAAEWGRDRPGAGAVLHALRPDVLQIRSQLSHQHGQATLRGLDQEVRRSHLHVKVPQVQRVLRQRQQASAATSAAAATSTAAAAAATRRHQAGRDLHLQLAAEAPPDRVHQRPGDGRVHP